MADNAQIYDFYAHFPLHLNTDDFAVFIKLVIAAWSQILFAFPSEITSAVGLWFVAV